MKTISIIRIFTLVLIFNCIAITFYGQIGKASESMHGNPISVDYLKQELQNGISVSHSKNQLCTDTVYSFLQNALYFCAGGNCDPEPRLYFEITGSYGAAATNDSIIVWLMTDDQDGSGPLSSLPDSMITGQNIHNTSNRAKWVGGVIPLYVTMNPLSWISPYSFQYVLPEFWSDSGRAICFTPIAWDSTSSNQLFELDNCFGVGQPIQKIVLKAIYADHYFTCDSQGNQLNIITRGGLPQYNHFNGYGDTSEYNVVVNSINYTTHYGDTLAVPALETNIISVTDSLSTPGIADGCVIHNETLVLYPPLDVTGLSASYFDNDSDVTITVAPRPSSAMRIDFLASDPVSDGIYLLNANGDTVFSQYPLGSSFGATSIVDIPSSLIIYDIPLSGGPYRVVATNDLGWGWQDASCGGLLNDGHLQVFDHATNMPLSSVLFPLGDTVCGTSGIYVVDTFGVYTLSQYNKTEISINSVPASLSAIDSLGNVVFSPSVAGWGNFQITYSYNDMKSGLCDKDTVFNVLVNSSVGIISLQNNSDVIINNPVHDFLFIKQNTRIVERIEVCDITGKIIFVKNIGNEEYLNLEPYSQGVYFIKLIDKNNAIIEVKKIVKN